MATEYRVSIRLTHAEHRQLVRLASETGMALSEAVRACIVARTTSQDVLREIVATRLDVDEARAKLERVARAESDRVITWLTQHVSS